MAQEERLAIAERNELRTRVAESEAQLEVLVREKQSLESQAEKASERAEKAEHEAAEKRDRLQKTQRDAESLERRVTAAEARAQLIDVARAHVAKMEGMIATEAERIALIEESLKRARNGGRT
jgi:hypothetical protein